MSRSRSLFLILIVMMIAVLSVTFVACNVNTDNACEHDYSYGVKQLPTMDSEGSLTLTCSKCDLNEEVVIPSLSDLSTWNWKVESTQSSNCEQGGIVKYTSVKPYAGIVVEINTEAKGHKLGELIPEVQSTCTTHGVSAHKECSECGKLFDKDGNLIESLELPLADHKLGALIPEVPSTCISHGVSAHKECSECGKLFDADGKAIDSLELPLADHKLSTLVAEVPATCTSTGIKAHYTCDECGITLDADKKVITDLTIPALSHEYGEGTVIATATCYSEGIKEFKCKHCDSYYFEYLPKVDHTSMKIEGYDATCTTDGLTDGEICSECGEELKKQEVIEATGHHHELSETIDATCISVGYKYYTCSCGDMYFETIEKIAHTPEVLEGYAPNCLEDGLTAGKYCSYCGEILENQNAIPATGHSWDDGVIDEEPTCTEVGSKLYTCENCGDTKTEEIEAKGHTPVVLEGIEATCTTAGLTEGSQCSECGEILVAQKGVSALGHDWDEGTETVSPDCTHKGEILHDCSRCDATKIEYVKANGHSYSDEWSFDKSYHFHKCDNCDSVADRASHMDANKDHKCDICGYVISNCVDRDKNHECDYCGASMGNHIQASGKHTCDYCGKVMSSHIGGTATCKEPATCTVCGQKYGSKDANNHVGHLVWVTDDTYHQQKYDCCGLHIGTKEAHTLNENDICTICGHGCNHSHTIHTEELKPTCTEEGHIEYWTCEHCSTMFSDEACTQPVANVVIPAKGHNYGLLVSPKAPNCTEAGYVAHYYCSDCKLYFNDKHEVKAWSDLEIEALGHDIDKHDAKAETCESIGWNAYETCSRCDYTTYQEIPAKGHNYGDWIAEVPAKCTVDGTVGHYHCSNCNKDFNSNKELITNLVLNKLGHTPKEAVVENKQDSTCIEVGHYDSVVYCSRCQDELSRIENIEIAKKAHIFGEWIDEVPATCVATGIKGHKDCSLCKKHYDNTGIEITDLTLSIVSDAHNWSDDWTGVEEGHYHLCTNEGCDKHDTLVSHTEGTPATCSTKAICSVCSQPYGEFDATKHAWSSSYSYDANKHWQECSNCDAKGNESAHADIDEDGLCDACNVDITIVAVFQFGANDKSVSNVESTTELKSFTETNNSYTLTFTSISKVYDSSYDAFGNSVLKLGTSSKIGSFSFTAPENITKVVFYVAGRQNALVNIDINGVSYSITSSSNSGNYQKIEIDVSLSKSISFATTGNNNKRCYVDKIEFYSNAQSGDHVCSSETLTHVPPQSATCTNNGNIEYWICSCEKIYSKESCESENEIKLSDTIINKLGHKDENNDGICDTCKLNLSNIVISIADVADDNKWIDAVVEPSFVYEGISFKASCTAPSSYGQNTGKYYVNGENWRFYQNENGILTITAPTGKVIGTIKITYEIKNTAIAMIGSSQVKSNETVTINAESIVIGVGQTGTVTNGIIQISAIEIVLNNGNCEHEGGTATCTDKAICTKCDQPYGELAPHDYNNGSCSDCGAIDPNYYFSKEISELDSLDDGIKVQFTGTVTKINTDWSAQYNNISVTVSDENGNTFYIYRLATKVALCDKITIKGVIGSYNNSKQIAAGATATIGEKNHNWATEYSHNDTHHWYECTICDEIKDNAEHDFSNGDCICGVNESSSGGECEHEGGTATCKDKAICTECGQPYGELADHTYGDWIPEEPATCVEAGTLGHYHCSVCEKNFGENKDELTSLVKDATGNHNYVNGTCKDCGKSESSSTTVTVVIADYAQSKGWNNDTLYSTINLDSIITATASCTKPNSNGQNTGKYFTNNGKGQWRFYQNETPSLTISAVNGYSILSVKITYDKNNNGVLTLNGKEIASATVVEVNGSSVTFSVGNTGTATNGQARITAIEVVYESTSTSGGETHTHTGTKTEAKPATCTEEGNIAYWTCSCDKIFLDADCKTELTDVNKDGKVDVADTVLAKLAHTFDQEKAEDKYLASVANCQSPAIYYKSCSCGLSSENTDSEATFTSGDIGSHNYDSNDECIVCHEKDPSKVFYLIGFINGSDYGCEEDYENLGDYQFVNGTVEVQFTSASYVFVKAKTNTAFYMTDGWLGEAVRSATLYNTTAGIDANKLYVPGNSVVTFTITYDRVNDTIVLSYTFVCVNHNWSNATCTAPKTCPDCGATEGSALGHDLGEWIEKSANCKEEGIVGHFECSVCHVKFAADKETVITETKIEIKPDVHKETLGTTWEKDETGHWHEYSCCNAIVAKADHTPDHEGHATEEYAITCTECGYVIESILTHEHTFGNWVDANNATCTEDGNVGYYYCSGCKKYYDSDKTTVINNVVLTKLGHSKDHHEAEDAEYNKAGNIEYWSCSRTNCGKYFSDADCTIEITDKDSVNIPALNRIYFTNTPGWATINAHTWEDGTENATTWPGVAMTKNEESGLYYVDVDSKYNKVIFNNGSIQTGNLDLVAEQNYNPFKAIHYYNEYSWENIYVHHWIDNGFASSWDSCPAMDADGSDGWYTIYIWEDCEKVKFKNNAGDASEQTGDLTIDWENPYYLHGTWVNEKAPKVTVKVNDVVVTDYTLSYQKEDNALQYNVKGLSLSVGDIVVITDFRNTTYFYTEGNFSGTATRSGSHDFYVKTADSYIWVTVPAFCYTVNGNVTEFTANPENDNEVVAIVTLNKNDELVVSDNENNSYTFENSGFLTEDNKLIHSGEYTLYLKLDSKKIWVTYPHNYGTKIDAKDASCTETGNYAYYYCADCGKYFNESYEEKSLSDLTISAKGHTYGAVSYSWNDTMTECTATRSCSVCSESVEGHTQTATATVGSSVTQNATCVLVELSTKTATFTETWAETQTVTNVQTNPALGHDFDTENWSSDGENGHYHACKRTGCTEKASLTAHADDNHDHKCDECTYIVSDCKSNAVPTAKKDANCTEDGYEAYWTCSVCGKKYSDANCTTEIENIVVIPAIGHSFTSETVHADYLKSEANCQSPAIYYKSCANCGLSSQGIVGKEATFEDGDKGLSNHTGEEKEWIAIVGQNKHKQVWKCCGTVIVAEEAHTLDEDGICTKCKEGCSHNLTIHYTRNEATCTEDGNIEYWSCTDCNKNFSDEECTTLISGSVIIDALGHNGIKTEAKSATCTATGNIDYWTCSRCNKIFTDEACKNELTDKNNDGNIDLDDTVTDKLAHTYDQEKAENKYLATEATCTENATYYKSCSCGLSSKDTESQATFEKADSALGHIDENKDHSCDRGCGESMGTHEGQLNSHNCAYCGNPASEHTGGTATCTEKAQCTICGEEYGNVLGHDVSKTTFARNEWKHWNECSRCGDKFNEAEHNYQETPDSYYEFNTSVCTGCNLVNDLGTEGLTYRYVAKSDSNPESYYIVTGYTGTATEVRIPYWGQSGEYMYKRVKYIDVNAFYSNSRITKVVLPSCLVEVGEKAFYNCSALAEVEMTSGNIRSYAFNKCTALTEINVPNTLEEGAFEGCTSLTTVKLFSGVYRIPNSAFTGCSSLSTIKYEYRNTIKEGLPSGIVSIGDYAFSGCSSLSNVDLPSDLDTLGIWAFQRTAIKSLTIPSKITEIPNLAFANCSELATINIHDNITKYGDSAFKDCALITTVPFSSKITHIGNHAFAGTAITSVHIPATVTKILGSAFSDCKSLTSLTFASGINLDIISGFIVDNTKVTTISIPDSVTQISDYAFWESKLTTINISTNSKLTYIGDSAFNKSTQLKSIYIPKGVTEIGWRAFNYCENLETVTFATNSELVTIGEEAFFGCYKLKSMVIPSGVTVIPKSAFVACREMTSITLPNNLTSIGEKAFEVCSMLDSISIPSGVKTIGDKAFSYCIELKSVTVPADTTLGNGVFANCPKLQLTLTGKGDLVFQNGMLIDTATKTLQIVTYTGSRFVLPDDGSITTIGSYAFYGCENLVELVMSESIVSFGDHAFADCPKLKSITFSSKITTITDYAFSYSGIESIVIPSTIETVGRYAFNWCRNLYSVTFEGVPTFDWGSFDGCHSLAELIELGGDIAYGNSYAKSFGAIVNKDGTTKITKEGDFAFITIDSDRYMIGYSGTDTDIVIPSGTTRIKDYAMRFNEEITSLVIPEGVVSIGVGSFQGLKSMTSVTLPTSLKSMGAYAFYNCLSLESISLPDGMKSIGDYAFQYCPFSNITIPSTVTTMGKGILASNEYLESITLPLKNRLLYLFDTSSSYIDRTKFYEAKETQSSILGYYIPLSLKSITVTGSSGLSSYAFSGFTSIESIDVSNATAIYSYAFMDCTSLTEVVLPIDTLTSIGNYAFKNCTSLSGITLPLNVGTIGQKLFEGCTSLDFVVFPRTIEKEISSYPFGLVVNNLYYNGTMEDYVSLSFTAYNALSTLANNVYLLQPNGTYAPFSGEVVIPEGVKSIGNYVFYGYQNITNIVIPEGVESIGVSAFEGCSLTSVVVPSTVTSIGAGVFGSNPYLESITVPFIGLSSGNVSEVPSGRTVHFFTTALNSGVDSTQFYTIFCSEKDYYIPLSLKSITVTGNYALKNYAFSGLKSVESIDVSNPPSISTGLFYNCSSLKTVKLPSVDFETIENYAFYKCSSLESLVLPDSVKKIGREAFYDCSSLKSVILPEGLKTINAYAFAGCAVTSIVVPSRVTEIGSGAFGSNPYLESLTVPFVGTSTTASSNSQKLIYFFQTSLNTGVDSSQFYIVTYKSTDYYIPHSLKSITFTGSVLGINAFDSLISLETVDISNVTYIDGAFANCTSLKSVTLSPSLKTISSDAFYNCTSLESLTLPEGLSTISSNAFAGCKFTSIVIPSSVKQFGNSAFENCTGLTEIEFKGTKAQWNAITKGTDWNKNVTATIICTDGTI